MLITKLANPYHFELFEFIDGHAVIPLLVISHLLHTRKAQCATRLVPVQYHSKPMISLIVLCTQQQ